MTGQKSGGRPSRTQAVARKEEILDAARALFAARGFAGTSIDELAAKVSASKHTIYRRFPSKLALIEAVMARDSERFEAALRAAGEAAADPATALEATARAYFRFSTSPTYSALYMAVLFEAATSAPLRAKLVERADMSLAPLRAAIIRAQAHHSWPHRSTTELCALLCDLLDGAAMRLKWLDAPTSETVDLSFARRWHDFLKLASLP